MSDIAITETLNMVRSGFLMGNQFSMGSGTFGTTGFFDGTPKGLTCPPIGGGGGTGTPIIRTKSLRLEHSKKLWTNRMVLGEEGG